MDCNHLTVEMRSLILLTIFGLVALSQASPFQQGEEWRLFKAVHNKQYASEAEEALRAHIYLDNRNKVQQHNARYLAGEVSFSLGLNLFADMLTSEVTAQMNGFRMAKSNNVVREFLNISLPDTVDWREKGYVTPVKNQKQCGSCWAFSTTGSLEGQHFAKTGKLVSLSEQQLVDCSKKNDGCSGGLMDLAFDYIKVNGIEAEASYPYKAKDQKCKFAKSKVVATVTGHVDVATQDESALQEAVATIGPVSVAIDASHFSFQLYSEGVYYEKRCSSTQLDHGVLAVGCGSDDGKDYWLVKNSWGASWGLSGYIKMARNKKNNCGIATQACYPTL